MNWFRAWIMRSIILFVGVTLLSGCAIERNAASQLISGGADRINAVSSVNKQLAGSNDAEEQSFLQCLAKHPHENIPTLSKALLSNNTSGSVPSATKTITSDDLSAYSQSLWDYTKQNKTLMLQVLALHRAQDRLCFEKEIRSLKNNNIKAGSNVSFSDYEQSQKILGVIYDYLHSTLSATDYSELDEQFARDHIPVKVVLPAA